MITIEIISKDMGEDKKGIKGEINVNTVEPITNEEINAYIKLHDFFVQKMREEIGIPKEREGYEE